MASLLALEQTFKFTAIPGYIQPLITSHRRGAKSHRSTSPVMHIHNNIPPSIQHSVRFAHMQLGWNSQLKYTIKHRRFSNLGIMFYYFELHMYPLGRQNVTASVWFFLISWLCGWARSTVTTHNSLFGNSLRLTPSPAGALRGAREVCGGKKNKREFGACHRKRATKSYSPKLERTTCHSESKGI